VLDEHAVLIRDALLRAGVYLHCNHGRSRSISFGMAFLMRDEGFTYDGARSAVAGGVKASGWPAAMYEPSVLSRAGSPRNQLFHVIEQQLKARQQRVHRFQGPAIIADGCAQAYDAYCKRRADDAAEAQQPTDELVIQRQSKRARGACVVVPTPDTPGMRCCNAFCCLARAADAYCASAVVRDMLAAVKRGDVTTVQELLRTTLDELRDAFGPGAPPRVNPLHVGVLLLDHAAVAALLDSGAAAGMPSLFYPEMLGCVDDTDKGDGLGDARRMVAKPFADALQVLNARKWLHGQVRARVVVGGRSVRRRALPVYAGIRRASGQSDAAGIVRAVNMAASLPRSARWRGTSRRRRSCCT
jgi:hypothetical protein